MERGYVKLWRKSLDTVVFTNPNTWLLWSYCLMKATHKKRTVMIGNQEISLNPGQFIFGRKKASSETGLSEQKIRTSLDQLRKRKNLTIKSTNKYSLITIINWDTYQPDNQQPNQQPNQQITSKQPTNNHRQECKELENNNTPLNPPKGEDRKNIFSELKTYLLESIPEVLSPCKKSILDFYKYRMDMPANKKYRTTAGIDGLFRDLTACLKNNLIPELCCQIAQENNWLTPRVKYFESAGLLEDVAGISNLTAEQIREKYGLAG